MEDDGVDFQLVPPRVHRRNAAERAIRTFKNYFIAMLCGTDPTFNMALWDKLLPQALITLNFLRPSRINPQLSAYAQMYGAFDYNRTPLDPLELRYSATSPQRLEAHGHLMLLMHGMWVPPCITIDAIGSGYVKPAPTASQTLWHGFPPKLSCPPHPQLNVPLQQHMT